MFLGSGVSTGSAQIRPCVKCNPISMRSMRLDPVVYISSLFSDLSCMDSSSTRF